MSILRQPQYAPVGLADQILLLYAVHKGMLGKLTEDDRTKFRKDIGEFARQKHQAVIDRIETVQELTPDVQKGLDDIMDAYFGPAAKGA